jgi:hypothetical protein
MGSQEVLPPIGDALVFTRQRVQDDHGDAQADPRPVANALAGGRVATVGVAHVAQRRHQRRKCVIQAAVGPRRRGRGHGLSRVITEGR